MTGRYSIKRRTMQLRAKWSCSSLRPRCFSVIWKFLPGSPDSGVFDGAEADLAVPLIATVEQFADRKRAQFRQVFENRRLHGSGRLCLALMRPAEWFGDDIFD